MSYTNLLHHIYLIDDLKNNWWLRRKLERDFSQTYQNMELK